MCHTDLHLWQMQLANETEWRSPPEAYKSTEQDLGMRAFRLKRYVKGRKGVTLGNPLPFWNAIAQGESFFYYLHFRQFVLFCWFRLPVFIFVWPSFRHSLDFSQSQSQHAWLHPYLPASFHPSLSFLWILLLVLSPPSMGDIGSGGVEKCKCWWIC